MTENRTAATSGGTSILGLLGVAFVVLKLTGFIDWSWLWVTAPFWGPIVFSLGLLSLILVGFILFFLAWCLVHLFTFMHDSVKKRK